MDKNVKKSKTQLTYEVVSEWWRYDSDTGILYWLKSPAKNVKAGDRAGTKNRLYEMVGFKGKKYLSSHIIWTLIHHYATENIIDHIDRNPRNNKSPNIRETSLMCNGRNSKLNKSNNTGIKGVIAKRKKYIVHIKNKGVQTYLGTFNNKIDAARARLNAERELGWDTCEYHSPAKQFVYLYDQAAKSSKKVNNAIAN